MELWIRSQDKERLIKASTLFVEYNGDVDPTISPYRVVADKCIDLGIYKSKERALEVLDEIESVMKTNCGFELYSRTGVYPDEFNKKWNCVPVYQMPES